MRFASVLAGVFLITLAACSGSDGQAATDTPVLDTVDAVEPELSLQDVQPDPASDPALPDEASPDTAVEATTPDVTPEVVPETGPEAMVETGVETTVEAEVAQAEPDDSEPPLEVAEPVEAVDDPGTPEAEAIEEIVEVDVAPLLPHVVVNEVVAKAVNLGPDWIELFNAGQAAADLTGWSFRDEDDTHIFTLVGSVTLEPGAYLILEGVGGTGPQVFAFGLSKADQARLFDAAGAPVDATTWISGAATEGFSWGRYPNGTGDFATLPTPTPGAPNVPPS